MTAWRTKVDAWKDELAKRPGLHIVPKHTVLSLMGAACITCDRPIIAATGKLVERRCGACNGAWNARFAHLRAPPPAA